MKIRKYNFEDAEAHAEVHRQSVRGIASKDYNKKEIEAWVKEDPEDEPLPEEKERFVAETEEDEIVGFSEYNKEEKELTGLYIKPEYSGTGLASQLLSKAEKAAKEGGIEKLNCTSTITAKEFYQRHGYEILEKTAHKMEEQNLTVYKMQKEL